MEENQLRIFEIEIIKFNQLLLGIVEERRQYL